MIDCEKCREMISCLLDGELSEEESAQVREHIGQCAECRAVFEAFSAVSEQMQSLEEVPDGLHEKIMDAIPQPKKKKGGIVWIKYLSAAACLALVIFAGAHSGVLSPADDAAEHAAPSPEVNSAVRSYSEVVDEGDMVCEDDLTVFTVSEEHSARFAELILPSGESADPPDGAPDCIVRYFADDGEHTVSLWLSGPTAFADPGSGPYPITATPDEILKLID